MQIVIGSDHAGFKLKEELKKFLLKNGYSVKDFGAFSERRCDYPLIGYRLSKAVASGKFRRGILVCATGIGQSIVANRIPGIRAALCHNIELAKLSRQHNDSNIIVFGAKFIKKQMAKKAVEVWLKTEFLGGRHARRLRQIEKIREGIIKK